MRDLRVLKRLRRCASVLKGTILRCSSSPGLGAGIPLPESRARVRATDAGGDIVYRSRPSAIQGNKETAETQLEDARSRQNRDECLEISPQASQRSHRGLGGRSLPAAAVR